MKEFMLIYKGGDPEWMKKASQEEMAASMKRWGDWMGVLQEKEQLASGGSPLNFSGKRLNQDGVVTDIAVTRSMNSFHQFMEDIQNVLPVLA